jgi:hypothetical protein
MAEVIGRGSNLDQPTLAEVKKDHGV